MVKKIFAIVLIITGFFLFISCTQESFLEFIENFGLIYAVSKDANDNIYLALSDGDNFYKEYFVAQNLVPSPIYLTILQDKTAWVQVPGASNYLSKNYTDWQTLNQTFTSNFSLFGYNNILYGIDAGNPTTLYMFNKIQNTWEIKVTFQNSSSIESTFVKNGILYVFYKYQIGVNYNGKIDAYNLNTYVIDQDNSIQQISSIMTVQYCFLFKSHETFYIGNQYNIYSLTREYPIANPIADSSSLGITFLAYAVDHYNNFWGVGIGTTDCVIAKVEGSTWVAKSIININGLIPTAIQIISYRPDRLAILIKKDESYSYVYSYTISKNELKELTQFQDTKYIATINL